MTSVSGATSEPSFRCTQMNCRIQVVLFVWLYPIDSSHCSSTRARVKMTDGMHLSIPTQHSWNQILQCRELRRRARYAKLCRRSCSHTQAGSVYRGLGSSAAHDFPWMQRGASGGRCTLWEPSISRTAERRRSTISSLPIWPCRKKEQNRPTILLGRSVERSCTQTTQDNILKQLHVRRVLSMRMFSYRW